MLNLLNLILILFFCVSCELLGQNEDDDSDSKRKSKSTYGKLDSSFGNNGILSLDSYDNPIGFALTSSGDVLLSLWSGDVLKFNSVGDLDSTFNNNTGVIDIGANSYGLHLSVSDELWIFGEDFANKYDEEGIIQTSYGSSGQISFASSFKFATTNSDLFVNYDSSDGNIRIRKFSNTGALDTSFGTGGTATLDLSGNVFSTGNIKISAAGDVWGVGIVNSPNKSLIVKFDADGDLDLSFGEGGYARWDNTYRLVPGDVIFDENNLPVVVSSNSYRICLTKFDGSGNLDTGFNSTGHSCLESSDFDFEFGNVRMIKVASNKYLIAAGGTSNNVLVAMFDAEGELVSSFGDKGVTEVDANSFDINSISVDSSNNIYVFGEDTQSDAPVIIKIKGK